MNLLAEELSYDSIAKEEPLEKPLWLCLEPPPNIYRDYLLQQIQELDIDYFQQKEEKRRKILKVTQEINKVTTNKESCSGLSIKQKQKQEMN